MHDVNSAHTTLVSILGLLFGFAVLSPLSAPAQTPAATVEDGSGNVVFRSFVEGQLLAPGALGAGTIPATGSSPAVRLMWHPAKAAFRAGVVRGSQWDDGNVGEGSVAFGKNTTASGTQAVAMGRGTTASVLRTIAMGNNTTASGNNAVALGLKTEASGSEATAMGSNTTASDLAATAMNLRTTASARSATAMGKKTTASGRRSTAMGFRTEAATNQSLSIGQCNSANQPSADGTLFVVGDGTSPSGGCDTRSDALVFDNSGNLTIEGVFNDDLGTFAGKFQASKNASDGSASSHVALVENTNTGTDADGLAIQSGPTADPGNSVNFITFFDGDGTALGSIEGTGGGDVNFNTSSADFAEELPVAEEASVPEPRALVGVRGGEISLETEGADRLMVVSSAPAVTGNTTPSTAADDDRRVAVAFIGQVPVRLRGEAEVGDLIVASGRDDGTARAVAPSEYRHSEHGPIVGQAWSAKATEGIGEVTVAVGLGRSGAVAERLQEQQAQIEALKAENEQIKERLAALEATVSADEPAVASFAGPWPMAVLLLALGLGGLLGAGLLWRRRA